MSTCHIQTHKVHLLFSSVHVGGKIKNVDLKIIKGLDIETTDANTSKGKCSSVRYISLVSSSILGWIQIKVL